jgi:UDP:flavonoid glycosyltransferase YjiC (YdhE family)
MRVLITLLHIHPMMPLAQALTQAGHDVAFACSSDSCQVVESLGYPCFVAGTDLGQMAPQLMAIPETERDEWVLKNIFAGELPRRMVPDLLQICSTWRPDVMVRDYSEVAGYIAAEMLGLPHASVEVGAFMPLPVLAQMLGENLNALRSEFGLPPDPEMRSAFRYLHLSFVPPSFHDPAFPMPPTTHALRIASFDRSYVTELPEWVDQLPDQPTVYATLGLSFSSDRLFHGSGQIFRSIIEGLRDEPVNLIVTVGPGRSPEEFGERPANVHVAQYIPQSLLFPRCNLVIAHGGWSTVMGAMSHGLPMLLIPIMGEQSMNAQRCEALGIGLVLELNQVTPQVIGDAVRRVMQDPLFRENAMRVRAESEALPGIEEAVELLEHLAAERLPVVNKA